MKAKYIFASLVAALAVLAGCQKEVTTHYLDEVSVSSSYVSIPLDGGSTPIGVLAQGSWTISGMPAWLTVSPATGSSGSTNVTFSADKALDGRTAEVLLTCNGATQRINVIQGLATVSPATCAEIIAGPDSKTYRVTGTVTSIANTQYGNWYLQDATGTVYIYGTLDAKGNEKNFLSLGIEVGDEVTVEGPKTTYNGTVELVNVTVLKINKSLIKVESVEPESAELPIEGGDFVVTLENKGQGVYVEIPEDAKDWLSISSIAGNVVTFHAAANAGGDRSTTITLKTTDGKKDYTTQQDLTQKGSIVECSVADFLAAEVGNTQYRITGVITKVAKAEYGNIYIRDWSGEAYVYGVGAKGDFEKLGLKVGDIVTLVGKRGEYKGDAQMTGGQYESHIAVTEISLADFLAKPDSKTDYYMVTGTVKDLLDNKGRTNDYGNLHLTDGTNELYVYGCYSGYGATGDNRKGFIASAGIKEGDELTMIGYKDTYNELIELCGGIYFSHKAANAE